MTTAKQELRPGWYVLSYPPVKGNGPVALSSVRLHWTVRFFSEEEARAWKPERNRDKLYLVRVVETPRGLSVESPW